MIPFPNKKYKIIYADPPWEYGDRLQHHGGSGYANGSNLPFGENLN